MRCSDPFYVEIDYFNDALHGVTFLRSPLFEPNFNDFDRATAKETDCEFVASKPLSRSLERTLVASSRFSKIRFKVFLAPAHKHTFTRPTNLYGKKGSKIQPI